MQEPRLGPVTFRASSTMLSFLSHERQRARILSFLSAALLALLSGSLYGFSAYSTDLGRVLARLNDQDEPINVDIIGSIGDLGLYLGILVGVFYDKYGSKATSIFSAIGTTISFSLVTLTLCGYLTPQVWCLCIYFFFIGQSSHSMYINAYSTTLKSYSKKHKGKLTGFFLALYGLSSVIYTLIFENLLDHDVTKLFTFYAVASASSSCLAIFFVRPYPPEEKEVDEGNIQDSVHLVEPDEEIQLTQKRPISEEVTGMALFRRPTFWLVFFVHLFCADSPAYTAGSGLVWKNIVGSVCRTFSLNRTSAPAMVITWSLVNTGSRISVGFLADAFTNSVPRPAWAIPCLLFAIASFISYFWVGDNPYGTIWAITVSSGIGYGGPFSLATALFAIYFGTNNIGFNCGILSFAPAISGTSFLAITNALLNSTAESPCVAGASCYAPAISLLITTLAVGLTCVGALTFYHYKHYQHIYLKYEQPVTCVHQPVKWVGFVS